MRPAPILLRLEPPLPPCDMSPLPRYAYVIAAAHYAAAAAVGAVNDVSRRARISISGTSGLITSCPISQANPLSVNHPPSTTPSCSLPLGQ